MYLFLLCSKNIHRKTDLFETSNMDHKKKRKSLICFSFFFFLNEQFMEPVTTIIPDKPGYMWEWIAPLSMYMIKWEPVAGYYSPPIMDRSVIKTTLAVYPELVSSMGQVIGYQGVFFKNITAKSGCIYLFYRQEFKHIEIWGTSECVASAMLLLTKHMQQVSNTLSVPAYCL